MVGLGAHTGRGPLLPRAPSPQSGIRRGTWLGHSFSLTLESDLVTSVLKPWAHPGDVRRPLLATPTPKLSPWPFSPAGAAAPRHPGAPQRPAKPWSGEQSPALPQAQLRDRVFRLDVLSL